MPKQCGIFLGMVAVTTPRSNTRHKPCRMARAALSILLATSLAGGRSVFGTGVFFLGKKNKKRKWVFRRLWEREIKVIAGKDVGKGGRRFLTKKKGRSK